MFVLKSLATLVATALIAPWQMMLKLKDSDYLNSAPNTIITPEFSRFVEKVRREGKVPGVSVGVVLPDGHAECGAWGNKTEDGDEMTTDTSYILASVSKAFLSSAMGILMDDFAHGRNLTSLPDGVHSFDWFTKIADLLPHDWELDNKWATEMANIRDVLSHVSGLPRHDYSYWRDDSPLQVVRRMRHLRSSFELRQQWSYNNQMYMLGSYIISKYAGMTYPRFAMERIFHRLNMTSTTFSESEASKDGKLTQSWTKFKRRIPTWFSDEQVLLNAGAGGVISNVEDLTQWLTTLINSGIYPPTNETVIPESVIGEVTTNHAVIHSKSGGLFGSVMGYGMGWMRTSLKGHEIVYHTGGIPGFSTIVGFMPREKIGVAVLMNADEKTKEMTSIFLRSFEDALGVDLNSASFIHQNDIERNSEHVKNASKSAPTLSIEDYVGTYFDKGYGNITLCAPLSSSAYCQEVLSDFSPFENFNSTIPSLYGKRNNVWSSHLRVVHKNGDTFNGIMTYLFPKGYGKDSTPFETWETGEGEAELRFLVEHDKVKGFGIFGTVNEETLRQRKGGDVRDTAEVWFDKCRS